MPKKPTLARKKPQYPMETSVWDDSKRLLIFVGTVVGGLLAIWIVFDRIFIPIRNNIELNNELKNFELPPEFRAVRTEEQFDTICLASCPHITKTYHFTVSSDEIEKIVTQRLRANGYRIFDPPFSGGSKNPYSLEYELKDYEIEITIRRH